MVDLTADCSQCAALCCVALAFDKGEMFAFDKPAGVACQHLNGHLCKIHAALDNVGLSGCTQYHCDGAGQRVVQEVFSGQSWQDNPALFTPMMDAFASMRKVHALLALLETAKALPLPDPLHIELNQLVAQLSPDVWTCESLEDFETSHLPKTVRTFLRSLKGLFG